MGDQAEVVPETFDEEERSEEQAAFGTSEYAKAILGGTWGKPPALDLEAEADLHRLLGALAARGLLHSARDIADGGIAVALAQSAFPNGIGCTVEQDESLQVHPLFGLFAEPASTVFVTAEPGDVDEITRVAAEHNFHAVRIGTTGGSRLQINVDREVFISAALDELRNPWAHALETHLHGEVLA
jgi:phosphoribosylformylglycinamidine (FGAM) synthase-like enzyme